MGLYATTTSFDFITRGYYEGNSTGGDPVGATISSLHITIAEGFVNSYLTSRYSLPFTTVPPLVRTLAEDIATYYMFRGSAHHNRKNEHLEEFKSAKETLKMIRDGELGLNLTDSSILSPNTTGRIQSSSEGYDQIFGVDDPENWEVDPDRLDDLEDSRQ